MKAGPLEMQMDARETADLERRVQAHEELLTALIASVGREHPAVLTRLEAMFAQRHGVGDDGKVDTLGHAEQILHAARRTTGPG